MTAPSVGRQSWQCPFQCKENGGLEFFKAAVNQLGMGNGLLHDGFFLLPSFGR